MASGKRSVKRAVIQVPQSLDEQSKFLEEIGKEQRIVDAINATLNERVSELQATAVVDAKAHIDRIEELVDGMYTFAEANRVELTDDGKKKTVELPTGSFRWRFTPPSVSLRNIEEVLSQLKTLKLERFIRTKEEVNKEALLTEPEVAESVKGVSIKRQEEFIVKPKELRSEIVSDVKKLKKRGA